MEKCLCGSSKTADNCCQNIVTGQKKALTAQELMRSRYYAYATQNIDYIMKTHHPDTVESVSRDVLYDWSRYSKWIALEIISTENGLESDELGIFEFKAIYEVNGLIHTHHEKSKFIKKDGTWFYHSALPFDLTIKNIVKVSRNSECICGSGKKYKKCCGK